MTPGAAHPQPSGPARALGHPGGVDSAATRTGDGHAAARHRPRLGRLATAGSMVALLAASWLVHWRTFHLRELGVDGYLSVDLGISPMGDMLAFTARDVHPPLFFALLHGWFALVGASYDTAKFVPIAWSLVALAALFSVGRLLLGRVAGLAAAAVLATSVSYLFQSPTVRPFPLGLALSLVSLALVVLLARSRAQRGFRHAALLTMLGAVSALALLSWYFHVAFLAIELAMLGSVAMDRRASVRRSGVAAAKAIVAGCVVSIPWYAYASASLRSYVATGGFARDSLATFTSLAGAGAAITHALTGAAPSMLTVAASVAWACAVGAGIVAVVAPSRPGAHAGQPAPGAPAASARLAPVALVAGAAVALAEVVAVLSRWQHPDAVGRYVLVLLPFAALLQAAAMTRGPFVARFASVACAVLVAVSSATWLRAITTGEGIDWTRDEDLAYVRAHAQPGDAVLFSDRARRSQYVLGGGTLPTAVIQTSGGSYLHSSAEDASATVSALASRARRIWYLETGELPGTVPVGRLALRRQVFITWHQTFGVKDTQLFLTRPAGRRGPADVTLGGAVTLVSSAFTSRATPGGAVDVSLVWRDLRPLGDAYSVFVHVDDASGKLMAQHDGPPAGDTRPTDLWKPGDVIDDRHGVVLPTAIAPGDYRVNVGMYRGDRRLATPDGATSVELGFVRVRLE